MLDARAKKLADKLVTYSCNLQKGEKILIEATDVIPEFVAEIVKRFTK